MFVSLVHVSCECFILKCVYFGQWPPDEIRLIQPCTTVPVGFIRRTLVGGQTPRRSIERYSSPLQSLWFISIHVAHLPHKTMSRRKPRGLAGHCVSSFSFARVVMSESLRRQMATRHIDCVRVKILICWAQRISIRYGSEDVVPCEYAMVDLKVETSAANLHFVITLTDDYRTLSYDATAIKLGEAWNKAHIRLSVHLFHAPSSKMAYRYFRAIVTNRKPQARSRANRLE